MRNKFLTLSSLKNSVSPLMDIDSVLSSEQVSPQFYQTKNNHSIQTEYFKVLRNCKIENPFKSDNVGWCSLSSFVLNPGQSVAPIQTPLLPSYRTIRSSIKAVRPRELNKTIPVKSRRSKSTQRDFKFVSEPLNTKQKIGSNFDNRCYKFRRKSCFGQIFGQILQRELVQLNYPQNQGQTISPQSKLLLSQLNVPQNKVQLSASRQTNSSDVLSRKFQLLNKRTFEFGSQRKIQLTSGEQILHQQGTQESQKNYLIGSPSSKAQAYNMFCQTKEYRVNRVQSLRNIIKLQSFLTSSTKCKIEKQNSLKAQDTVQSLLLSKKEDIILEENVKIPNIMKHHSTNQLMSNKSVDCNLFLKQSPYKNIDPILKQQNDSMKVDQIKDFQQDQQLIRSNSKKQQPLTNSIVLQNPKIMSRLVYKPLRSKLKAFLQNNSIGIDKNGIEPQNRIQTERSKKSLQMIKQRVKTEQSTPQGKIQTFSKENKRLRALIKCLV